MSYRGRFAPTPSGPLHFGSLVAALGSWLRARSQHGQWLLRVEDLDPPRIVEGASALILDALAALGLHGDGPASHQGARGHAYARALRTLKARDLVFPCWCSRSDLAAQGGLHRDGHCIARPSTSREPAWRLRCPEQSIAFEDRIQGQQTQVLHEAVGDFVLRRADGLWAYQLAVVVDDAAQEISEVVRGADLLDSTPRQILLQRMLDLPTPRYAHLPLVLDRHGRKLSKSQGDRAVCTDNPLAALAPALEFLGQCVPAESDPRRWLKAAITGFDLERVPRVHGAPMPRRGSLLPPGEGGA